MTLELPNKVLLGKHTRREFRQRMSAGELQACIIPIAATEQHLEHLAMEHDNASVMHVSTSVAAQLDPHVIVSPVMNIGISEHHMRHPGTLTAMPGSFLAVLFDAIRSMHSAGFENILVLNGHGGNIAPCEGIWGQFLQRLEINLQFKSYWDFLTPTETDPFLETGRCPGHAQEFETAFALAAFPENVRCDAMKDQADQEPLSANAENGRALIDLTVKNVATFVQGMLDGTEIAEIPAFHE